MLERSIVRRALCSALAAAFIAAPVPPALAAPPAPTLPEAMRSPDTSPKLPDADYLRSIIEQRVRNSPAFLEAKKATLDAYAWDSLLYADLPGAVVAIVRDGRIWSLRAYGFKRKGSASFVRPSTQFMIGSVSKPVTTTLAGAEIDGNFTAWNVPVQRSLPQFRASDPARSATLTLEQMFCNCTAAQRRDAEIIFNGDVLSANDILDQVASIPLQPAVPGAFLYNNQFVATGGYAVGAAATGNPQELLASYTRRLQERVLDPIGMTSTTLSFDAVRARGDYAQPHGIALASDRRQMALDVDRWATPIAPGGGVWSSAGDIARWVAVQLGRGTTPEGRHVVSAANIEKTWARQTAITPEIGYGLGWFTGSWKGRRMVFHGGNTLGFTADVAMLPDDNIGVVVLSNAQSTGFNTAMRYRVLETLFDEPHEYDATFRANEDASVNAYRSVYAQTTAVPEAEASPFLGNWTSPAVGRIGVSYANGTLTADFGDWRSKLRRYVQGGIVYWLTDDEPVSATPFYATLDANGAPTLTLFQGGRAFPLTRVP